METQGAEIRRIKEADLSAYIDVIRHSFQTVAEAYGLDEGNCPGHPAFIREERFFSMQERGARFFELYAADGPIGFVAVEGKGDAAHIEKLAVLPGCRHRGYGKALMDAALDCAKGQRCRRASIGIIDENRVLKDWYGGMGFTVVDIKEYNHLPFAVCIMEKAL